MVKRSRSAARLQSVDSDDFGLDGVNPDGIQIDEASLAAIADGSICSLGKLMEPSMKPSEAITHAVSAFTVRVHLDLRD
jgi:hypothetical protein